MEEEIISSTMTKTQASDSNSSNSPLPGATTTTTTCSSSKPNNKLHGNPSSKYKGVVPQQNGHWGAQIYANHHRIWLGTFKTEAAAASAYDSAAIKLRPGNSGDPHRNFPWTGLTVYEPAFQAHFSTDQVLNMIKDGSYQTKFGEFLSSMSQSSGGNQTSPYDKTRQGKKEGYYCQELFRKELTPSDVGKLNRLVIPKRYALKFFPIDGEDMSPNNYGGGGVMELIFYDKSMKSWKFRYCYWKSSQSFVFTRGWNKFVKDKDLKAKDTVAFYLCELRENNGNDVKKFCMIDIVGLIGNVSPYNISVKLEQEVTDQEERELLRGGEATTPTEKQKGFRLFGVQIS